MKTDIETLIAAMRILAADIQTDDGVANAAISEAADRLEEFRQALEEISQLHLGGIEFAQAAAWAAVKRARLALGRDWP